MSSLVYVLQILAVPEKYHAYIIRNYRELDPLVYSGQVIGLAPCNTRISLSWTSSCFRAKYFVETTPRELHVICHPAREVCIWRHRVSNIDNSCILWTFDTSDGRFIDARSVLNFDTILFTRQTLIRLVRRKSIARTIRRRLLATQVLPHLLPLVWQYL